VGQERQTAGGFNLVSDPIPVPYTLQGDRSAAREGLQESLDGARLMLYPLLGKKVPILI
jgi:hypothetical protein